MPRSLTRLIILLKVPPRSQIMPPCQYMEKLSTPFIQKLYPRWFLKKLVLLTEIEYLQHCPRSSESFHMRFCSNSSAMDTWYLFSLVTHLNWTGFLENFLASSILQQFQVKSSRNGRELKWLILWQTTAEILEKKPSVFTSYFHKSNDGAKLDYWAGRKTLLYFRLYDLMTWV